MEQKKLTFSLFFLLMTLFMNAQDANVVDEMIGQRELSMKTYTPDTSAVAVVLFDLGDLNMSYDGRFMLKRKRQVKILKQSGINSHGTFQLVLDINYQALQSINGRVIQPDSSITALKATDIFFDKLNDDRAIVKVVFPNMKVGTIIEVDYTLFSATLDVVKWSFQENIPIRRNMLLINMPDYIEYDFLYKGLIDYKIGYIENKNIIGALSRTTVLIMDTVPVFKIEPFMPAIKDVSCGLSFSWKKYKVPNTNKVIVNDSYFINNQFLEHKKFGDQYLKKSNYRDLWNTLKPLLANATTQEESLKMVFEYISKNIRWIDNFFSPFVEKTLDHAFKKKTANSGEMNLMMVACLREAGLNAYPLLISTFDNGTPSKDYASASQFDHVLCYVQINDKDYFLDAGNSFRNIYLPRRVSISGQGWLVDKTNSKWVNLPHPVSEVTTTGNISLEQNGQLKCHLTNLYKGYAAVDERDNLEKDSKKEFVKKEFLNRSLDINMNSIDYDSINDLYAPLKRRLSFNINESTIVTDSLLFLNTPLWVKYKDIAFKDEQRTQLIVFNTPLNEHYSVTITLPHNYKIEELPADFSETLGKDDAFYSFSCIKTHNAIQIKTHFQIKTLYYHFNRYKEIKSFFDNIANKFAEQIVLKKAH
ncbi:MAG: DUF3857 and transglutaminase domain-containing protein [Saprospiraceae bacterium]|nr:DUF3857 and transglutaminase domain-containing protein [Saprospiraceae bacterium]